MGECRYWKQGRCKFGDSCRFEHVGPPGGGGGGGDHFNSKPHYHRNNHNRNNSHNDDSYDSRPTWPLSVVGLPNLTQGNLVDNDISPEELRVNAYMQAPRGKSEAVSASENNLVQEHQAKEAQARAANPSANNNGMQSQRQPQAIATLDPFASNGGGGGGYNSNNGYNNSSGMNDVRQQPSDPFASSGHQQSQYQPQNNAPFSNGASFGSSSFGAPTSTHTPVQPSTLPSIQTPFVNTTPQQPASTPFTVPMTTPTLTPKPEANLTQKDVAQFNAQSFGFDPVPETAPPPRFC